LATAGILVFDVEDAFLSVPIMPPLMQAMLAPISVRSEQDQRRGA
jgi:hypothetical protein